MSKPTFISILKGASFGTPKLSKPAVAGAVEIGIGPILAVAISDVDRRARTILRMVGASITPKLLAMPVAEETLAQLGWPTGYAFTIGLIELTCLVL